jgi:hypothetical protein
VLQTGDILVGRYEVDSLLGRGGMSSVFSAFDRTLGRDSAAGRRRAARRTTGTGVTSRRTARLPVTGDGVASYSLRGMRVRLSPLAGLAIGLTFLASALTGCGGSSSTSGVASKSPAEIVAAARAAADEAASVHVSGAVVEGAPLSLDMQLLAGKGGHGRITENGLSFELITLGSTVYIKGSSAFYRHLGGPAAAQLLKGKWLKAPAAAGEFAAVTSLTDLRKLLDTTLASHGALAVGAGTTINGQKVVAVKDLSKGGILYVAATGKSYPVEVARGGANGGHIVFDRWNEAVTISPPLNAINLNQLRPGH